MAREFQLPASTPSSVVLTQNRVLRNTYWLLGLSMIPTVIGAYLGANTNFSFLAQYPIMGPLVMFGVMMAMLYGVSAMRDSSMGVVLLLGFTFVAGFFLGPILQAALSLKNGAQLVGLAAGGTGLIFMSLATYATVTKRDFSFMGKFLFVGMIALVIAMFANMFLQIPALGLAISTLVIVVFSLFLLHDLSRIITGGETNYVMATTGVYLSLLNIFASLLQLLMALTGEKD